MLTFIGMLSLANLALVVINVFIILQTRKLNKEMDSKNLYTEKDENIVYTGYQPRALTPKAKAPKGE